MYFNSESSESPAVSTMKKFIFKSLMILSLIGCISFSNLQAQSCGACDGQKTTCGEPNCDFDCPACEGPSIPVDNGVWVLLLSGGLAIVYFFGKRKSLLQTK